ncbi:MAG: hypothetical protein GX335_07380 [Firmicutes bacterium]|nr:hypothetical protein [Bacillota bacterium]
MEQEKAAEIRKKMGHALRLMYEAAELSISLVKEDGREQIKTLWEDFIREFFRYTKKRSRETGVDLISLVSLAQILK